MTCNTTHARRPQNIKPHFGNIVTNLLNTAVGDVAQKTERKHFTNPATNVIEYDNRFELELALPGFTKKDVSITFEKDRLSVKANETKNNKTQKFRLREFNYKGFAKHFNIPETVDPETINAQFDLGILKITLGKKKEATPQPPKEIKIK